MKKIFALLALPAALLATPALAQSLPIPNMPTMRDFPGANELPDPKLDYKIVFDMQTFDKPDQVNQALATVAVIINTYEKHGVTPDHLHLWAVFHGPTIAVVTDDATYKGRTGVEHNPNAALLEQLSKAGLKMAVCGQSAMAQHYDFKSILPVAQMNLSATSTFINLETRGYIKVNE